MRSFLDSLLKASNNRTAPTTSDPFLKVNRMELTPEDIKELMGFDRNDPSVTVKMIPAPGLKEQLASGKGVDLDKVAREQESKDLYDALARSIGQPATSADDKQPGDPNAPVTGAVTEPVPEPVSEPEIGPEEQGGTYDVLSGIADEVDAEIERALDKHPSGFNSAHEGYAILKEKVDKLWTLIATDQGYSQRARVKAIQVAAVAIRYVLDLEPGDVPVEPK